LRSASVNSTLTSFSASANVDGETSGPTAGDAENADGDPGGDSAGDAGGAVEVEPGGTSEGLAAA
jgi:hypothetical protein